MPVISKNMKILSKKFLLACAFLCPWLSPAAISIFPGASAAFTQTTLTTENTRFVEKLTGYTVGGFLLTGFKFGNQRLHFGSIADSMQSSNSKMQGYRVGGEVRFDMAVSWPLSPFTRLQYTFDRWTFKDLDRTDFSATGRTLKAMAGVGFPIRDRLLLAFEAGFQYGVMDGGDGRLSSDSAIVKRLENRDVFTFIIGINIGYRFFD